jgi:hypothetical protein
MSMSRDDHDRFGEIGFTVTIENNPELVVNGRQCPGVGAQDDDGRRGAGCREVHEVPEPEVAGQQHPTLARRMLQQHQVRRAGHPGIGRMNHVVTELPNQSDR